MSLFEDVFRSGWTSFLGQNRQMVMFPDKLAAKMGTQKHGLVKDS